MGITSAGFIDEGQNLIILATAEIAFSVAHMLFSERASGSETICTNSGMAWPQTSV